MDRHITLNHFDFDRGENLFLKVASKDSQVLCDICNMSSNEETIHLFKPEHSSVTEETWLCDSCADEEFGEGNWD